MSAHPAGPLGEALSDILWPFAATEKGRCPNFEECPDECDCITCKALVALREAEDAPSSPSTHQDSPKVPEERYKIWRGPTGNTVEPLGKTPELERGDNPIEVIPVSALLSDEVVRAHANQLYSRYCEIPASDGFDGETLGARQLWMDRAREDLQALIEHVRDGQGGEIPKSDQGMGKGWAESDFGAPEPGYDKP